VSCSPFLRRRQVVSVLSHADETRIPAPGRAVRANLAGLYAAQKRLGRADNSAQHTRMPPRIFPACPSLPPPVEGMDWRSFAGHGKTRDAAFYFTALQYGHSLWQRGFAARAVLCLDRAFGSDLKGNEDVLRTWPLPYQAIAWFLTHTPTGVFMGNPRVHFQHLADRMRPPRKDQRRWRAWACWEISRLILPELPGDPRHIVEEPTREQIREGLRRFGHGGEQNLWNESLIYAAELADQRPQS
jgi:hypothetical protein